MRPSVMWMVASAVAAKVTGADVTDERSAIAASPIVVHATPGDTALERLSAYRAVVG